MNPGPIGYYRLGQSYPRSAARQSYPRRRRVWFVSAAPPGTSIKDIIGVGIIPFAR